MRVGGKGASPGNLSLLFLIVKAVNWCFLEARMLPFDKPRLIEKSPLNLYRQLHVVIQNCTPSKHNLEGRPAYHLDMIPL